MEAKIMYYSICRCKNTVLVILKGMSIRSSYIISLLVIVWIVITTIPKLLSNSKSNIQQFEQIQIKYTSRVISSSNGVITGNSTSLSSSYASSSLSLSYVPILPFMACNGRIEKIVCQKTIFFDSFDDILPPTILPISTDVPIQERICTQLTSLQYSVTGIAQQQELKNVSQFYNSNTNFTLIRIPVCVQTISMVGVVVKKPKRIWQRMHVVKSIDDKVLQKFINSIRSISRIIPLKHIDFVSHYKLGILTRPDMKDRLRDDNYGNMVWRYAATKLINPITVELDPNDRISQYNFTGREPIQAMVIASANALQISEQQVLRQLVDLLTKRVVLNNVPTVVIGIGIQKDFNDELLWNMNHTVASTNITAFVPDLQLSHPFQVEFLQTVAKQQSQPAIGVRGDLTKLVCDNAGITNCISMGCPSLTISRDLNLGKTTQSNWENAMKRLSQKQDNNNNNESPKLKIAVTCPADDRTDVPFEIIGILLDLYGSDQVTIITQTPNDEHYVKKFLQQQWLERFPRSTLVRTDENNSTTITNQIKYVEFMNVETWLYEASQFDLCVSFRIHGSMMFIETGIPTIVIPTDFRIMELVYAMKLPFLLPSILQHHVQLYKQQYIKTKTSTVENDESYSGNQFLLSLFQEALNTFDFNEFEANRRDKIRKWKSILSVADLEIDPSLLRVINQQ